MNKGVNAERGRKEFKTKDTGSGIRGRRRAGETQLLARGRLVPTR